MRTQFIVWLCPWCLLRNLGISFTLRSLFWMTDNNTDFFTSFIQKLKSNYKTNVLK
jgi:hypothetical protein